MAVYLLLAAAVIIACVFFNKIFSKIGMPILLAFILLGMFFGTDGIVKIPFEDYVFAEKICSVALIFIMFYGGFGTKWSEAKPVAVKAILLSSLGTVLTAGLVGLFCYYVLRVELLESFLIGAVICSTDAASVFSILRSKRVNLRYSTASLLEIESGSNDPFSYMLTVIVLSLMAGSEVSFGWMLLMQVGYGVLFGVGIAAVTLLFLRHFHISSAGFSAIFIVAVAIFSYAAPAALGGNGYLSAYIAGIILGNFRLQNKQELVHFFDGTTGLMQMLLFFLLGLLSTPSRLPQVALPALFVALFLTFVARPIAVGAIMTPFKSVLRQQLLVAWAGMRGAASIVFAIMAVIHPASPNHDIFHFVFFIVLFSILLQGTLLPILAKLLNMTDDESDVMRTFTDYAAETPIEFIEFTVPNDHFWDGKKISELDLPPDLIFVLVIRGDERIVPKGRTVLLSGDVIVLGGIGMKEPEEIQLSEHVLEKDNAWVGKNISQLPIKHNLVVLIKRGNTVVIPKGSTRLFAEDVLVITDTDGPFS